MVAIQPFVCSTFSLYFSAPDNVDPDSRTLNRDPIFTPNGLTIGFRPGTNTSTASELAVPAQFAFALAQVNSVSNANSPLFAAGGRETVVALPSQVCACEWCGCGLFSKAISNLRRPCRHCQNKCNRNTGRRNCEKNSTAGFASLLCGDAHTLLTLILNPHIWRCPFLALSAPSSTRRRRQIGVDDCGRTPGRAVAALTAILQHRAPLAIVGPGCGAVVQV